MASVLIYNVGNRDVQSTDPEVAGLPARARGEVILADYPRLLPTLTFPIISKALDYVKGHEGQMDQVVLVYSDQPPESTPPQERDKDTVSLARVISRYLQEQYSIHKKNIFRNAIDGNPADYDVTLEYFRRELPRIKGHYPDGATFYLALSAGTPAMTAMLLSAGVQVFGLDCRPLYIVEGAKVPVLLQTARKLYGENMADVLRTHLSSFSYKAALDTMDRHASLLVENEPDRQAIRHLLMYAHHRLALDSDAARSAIEQAVSCCPSHRPQLQGFQDAVCSPAEESLMAEVCFSAEIKYQNAEYADFVQRVFRFHEGALGYIAEKCGARFEATGPGHSRRNWDRGWLGQQEGLEDFAALRGIDLHQEVNRRSIRCVLQWLLASHGEYAGAVAALDKFEKLAALRNRSVHSYYKVSRVDLESAWEGDPAGIVDAIRDAWGKCTGQPLGENPFRQVNSLIGTILREGK